MPVYEELRGRIRPSVLSEMTSFDAHHMQIPSIDSSRAGQDVSLIGRKDG
jgi:hypothetical protein